MKDEDVERVATVFIEHLLSGPVTAKEWQEVKADPEWPKALAAARAAIAAYEAALWREIESAPMDGTWILGRVDPAAWQDDAAEAGWIYPPIQWTEVGHGAPCWIDASDNCVKGVTHWRPLPRKED